MSAFFVLLALIVLAFAGSLWAVDSRHSDHLTDRYWWPRC
jgi:hypothetical protein